MGARSDSVTLAPAAAHARPTTPVPLPSSRIRLSFKSNPAKYCTIGRADAQMICPVRSLFPSRTPSSCLSKISLPATVIVTSGSGAPWAVQCRQERIVRTGKGLRAGGQCSAVQERIVRTRVRCSGAVVQRQLWRQTPDSPHPAPTFVYDPSIQVAILAVSRWSWYAPR